MIGLITYDCPHLKTQHLIEQCSKKIVAILLIPFKKRLSRKVLFNHRPFQFKGPSPQELAKSIGAEVINLSEFRNQKLSKKIYFLIFFQNIYIISNYSRNTKDQGLNSLASLTIVKPLVSLISSTDLVVQAKLFLLRSSSSGIP